MAKRREYFQSKQFSKKLFPLHTRNAGHVLKVSSLTLKKKTYIYFFFPILSILVLHLSPWTNETNMFYLNLNTNRVKRDRVLLFWKRFIYVLLTVTVDLKWRICIVGANLIFVLEVNIADLRIWTCFFLFFFLTTKVLKTRSWYLYGVNYAVN